MLSQLQPTDIPKHWLESECEGCSIGRITNKIADGKSPVPDHLCDHVSRKTVARAKSIYGLFTASERYKQESWLRSLYQDATAAEEGEAHLSDVVAAVKQDEAIDSISRATISKWLDVYDIPTDQPRDKIPRTDELDRAFFDHKYNEEQLTLNQLRDEVNERIGDDIEISKNTLVSHLDWLDIDTRSQGVPQRELPAIENIDEYVLNHHYRVQQVADAAPVNFEGSVRLKERWLRENDTVDHWRGKELLPKAEILYAQTDGVDDRPALADLYDQYRDSDQPVWNLADAIGVAPAAVELALVFHGIREELTFVEIDDPTVIENVPNQRSELLTDCGAFAVLRLTFGLELTEIAAYLNVCEGLVKFASRMHDIPVETDSGRQSGGHCGRLHDPRYLRRQLTEMSIRELAARHGYESGTPVKRLLDAFELTPPTQIEVPELGCSVRSELEKHVGKRLAQLATEHPEMEVGYETTQIELDISAFECSSDQKQYVPDYTVETGQQTVYIEVKGQIDNGIIYDHMVTDRQKAKAMMDALGDDDTEQYVVITNGAELGWYDYEFSFVEDFETGGSFNKYDQILANRDKLESLLAPGDLTA